MNRAHFIIEQSLNYIENNIKEKLSLADLADHAGVSKYHLDRIFTAITGESLMGYATSRKLSTSIVDLLKTKMKIIDIAFEYGFDYEQSYIRSFKKLFGQTPMRIRMNGESIKVQEKIDLNEIVSIDDAITYRPFFVVKPGFQLIGKRYIVPEDQDHIMPNRVGREFFSREKEKIRNAVHPNVYIGYVELMPVTNGYIYIPSIQVKPGTVPPDGTVGFSIPTYTYAVFRFVGFFHPDQINVKHFAHLLDYMYKKWIIQAGYKIAAPFRFEYIDFTLAKEDYCELDLYQPICLSDRPS